MDDRSNLAEAWTRRRFLKAASVLGAAAGLPLVARAAPATQGDSRGSAVPSSRLRHRNQNLFLNGANVPWRHFAADVGRGKTDFAWFGKMFDQLEAAGSNSARWWIHTTGGTNPEFDEAGFCSGLESSHIPDMKRVLDMAWERGLVLCLSLWSFDMLAKYNEAKVIARNKQLLGSAAHRNAYLEKALEPMVKAFKGHPGLLCWEVFNEPEGMSHEFGWEKTAHVPMGELQRFINLCAGVIRRADATAKVTNGCNGFEATTEVGGRTNWYSDAQLIAAGGDRAGTLDFYQVHYYDWGKTELSPFHHPASYWKLDKPIVVGEFFVQDTFGVRREDTYVNLYENGYAGAWGWAYSTKWKEIRAGLESLRKRSPRDVKIVKS